MKQFSINKLFTNCTGNTTIFTGKLTTFKQVVHSVRLFIVRPHFSNTIANISFNYLSQTATSFRFHLNLEWYAVVNIKRPSRFLHYTCMFRRRLYSVRLSQLPPPLGKVRGHQPVVGKSLRGKRNLWAVTQHATLLSDLLYVELYLKMGNRGYFQVLIFFKGVRYSVLNKVESPWCRLL